MGESLTERRRVDDDFTYVPALYRKVRRGGYLITGVDKTVKKRIEPDLENLPFPRKPIIPLTRIVQDRITVEVNRGCASGCRYCAAGFIYRPVRERSVEGILHIVSDSLAHTGYDEVALLSLSAGDYPGLQELVRRINEEFAGENVSISLPSLRVNSANIHILRMVKEVRKSGLTFAIESADALTRNRLNKPVDIEQLKYIIGQVSRLGWRLIKLYFMIGLPMAEKEDERIGELVFELLEVSRSIQMNVNVSVFIPKPHTPFQFSNQIEVEEAERIIRSLRDRFSRTRVHVKFQDPRMSLIEGVLSRGDRRISRLIQETHKLGERFSSWDDVFCYDLWEKALKRLNINLVRYTNYEGIRRTNFHGVESPSPTKKKGGTTSPRKAGPEIFPWYFISSGIRASFFKQESERARGALLTANCLHGECTECGVCQREIRQTPPQSKSHIEEGHIDYPSPANRAKRSVHTPVKMLFQFKKQGFYRFISHLDLLTLLVHLGKMAGVPYSYSKGFNPKPHLVLPFPLPLGVESEYEIGEAYLDVNLEDVTFVSRYNSQLPEEMRLSRAERSSTMKSVASAPFFHDYSFPCSPDVEELLKKSIERREIFDSSPLEFYIVQGAQVKLRIGSSRSIKKLLNHDKDLFQRTRLKRIMLWQKRGGRLATFFDEQK
jgi:radical SAM-linked protein